ncbi:hypothetical protein MWG46_07995 [Escherichia coli]|nr:hypothetical protein [Escherichia coli]
MSQIENAVTSSRAKRALQKGNPLTGSRETTHICFAEKAGHIKRLMFSSRRELKDDFDTVFVRIGLNSKKEMIEHWIFERKSCDD